MIIDILGIDRNIDVIVFLLQSSESGNNLAFFVWLQESLGWCKLNLILIFVWYLPFVLKWNSRFILDKNILLGRDTCIHWWEEQLLIIAQLKLRFITVTNQVDLLYI